MIVSQHNQRLFYSDNGTLSDLTTRLNDFRDGSFDLSGYVPGEDYIYIGADLPFSHKYFDLSAFNSDASNIVIEYWDNSQWRPVIDVINETLSDDATKSFTKSGIISWKSPRSSQAWVSETESSDIPELSSTLIYCFYWLRISFTGTLSSGTTLNHIGYKFADDNALFGEYPDLNNQQMMDAFEPTLAAGTKTDWKEQELIASSYILTRMGTAGIAFTPSQILNFDILKEPCIHKTAEIIYAALGDPYEPRRKLSADKFNEAFSIDKFQIDTNADTKIDGIEKIVSQSFLSR